MKHKKGGLIAVVVALIIVIAGGLFALKQNK